MSEEDHSDSHVEEQDSYGTSVLSAQRDLEHEITFALIFNWFIGWPVLFLLSTFLTYTISKHYVTEPFIDEIFHIPQTIQYFHGDFKTWDPKITTPPGLYYLGYVWSKIIKLLHLPVNPIGLGTLRYLNTIGGTLVLPYVLNPLFVLNPIGFWPVSLISFPVLSSFYTLYYTDVWATIMIVSSLSVAVALPYSDKTSIRLSALLGLISVFFRQTNIIWNIFILVLVVERRAMIQKNFTKSPLNNIIKFIIQFAEDFNDYVLPYVINMVLFFIFVIYNRGITLGDKENHVAGLHIAQIFYCFSFLMVFSLPLWLSQYRLTSYFARYKQAPIFIFFEFLIIAFFVRFFTVVHPFLLADNRHFTFYIWRKIINSRWYTKYLIIPVYHFSIYVVIQQLIANAFYFDAIQEIPFKNARDLPLKPTGISITALLGCIFLTIVPSPLFEPRYYIVPYIFFRLFVAVPYETFFIGEPISDITLRRLKCELSYFIVINTMTTLIFIFYTFSWDSESALQRIIW
ncbi:glycosyltransferase family 59 protein [Wickerhamomyces anomalus NRRL Y-366-8]|uniref:Dol-P-Glc:Glc(2)Man(9)GlcNAc(2)-PP-Dol alpha-1,2-glucosyltransferase n=1 Tax=Wickerhamomyces anomalus (strain ATCC 58044 / CBS 1984 / NCYC 433 / NRRL Y-366-8) TaxID=683960 RepID=A0A1E3P2A8_WICAA|nr:glycosyltransferase family 59 protein [Wickerhamomyces anomalus NRRL Y-366-8]ODQ59032.1 glycosyltransferase family 59 protein [Wickerhamomyces anomalus NRRL Y-366-8]